MVRAEAVAAEAVPRRRVVAAEGAEGAAVVEGQEDDLIDQYELGSDSTAAERAGRREGTSAVVRLAEELLIDDVHGSGHGSGATD